MFNPKINPTLLLLEIDQLKAEERRLRELNIETTKRELELAERANRLLTEVDRQAAIIEAQARLVEALDWLREVETFHKQVNAAHSAIVPQRVGVYPPETFEQRRADCLRLNKILTELYEDEAQALLCVSKARSDLDALMGGEK